MHGTLGIVCTYQVLFLPSVGVFSGYKYVLPYASHLIIAISMSTAYTDASRCSFLLSVFLPVLFFFSCSTIFFSCFFLLIRLFARDAGGRVHVVRVHNRDDRLGVEHLRGAGDADEELRQHSRATRGEEGQGAAGSSGRSSQCHGPEGELVGDLVRHAGCAIAFLPCFDPKRLSVGRTHRNRTSIPSVRFEQN